MRKINKIATIVVMGLVAALILLTTSDISIISKMLVMVLVGKKILNLLI